MPTPRRHLPVSHSVVGDGLAAVLEELEIPASFPDDVMAAAAALPTPDVSGRVDRRDLAMVTIDPPGSTDLDQALAIDPVPGGGHVVWYAIADVAAFIRPGDPIDVESRRGG